jgi:nitrogen-specific signal transduction histidine kinase
VLNHQLTPSDQRLVQILDSLLLGAIIINPREHTVIYANEEAARMMAREPAELLGHVCHNFICPVAVGQCPITDLEQQIDRSERCVLTRDGLQVPILKTVRKIEFIGSIHLLETFMDISGLKEKERLMGVLEMAGAASHYLGQPLQIIMTSLELLQKPHSEHVDRNLNSKIIGSMHKLKAIIDNIQNITRYRTEEYVQGRRIVDIAKSSSLE